MNTRVSMYLDSIKKNSDLLLIWYTFICLVSNIYFIMNVNFNQKKHFYSFAWQESVIMSFRKPRVVYGYSFQIQYTNLMNTM